MVQIRSLDDHKSLPGIKVRDVVEKLGYNTMDNGYLSFKDCRIPRTNLLSRFVDVDKEGGFPLNGESRMVY